MTGDVPYYADVHSAFMSKLNSEGYSGNVKVIVQKPYPAILSLANAARKLIALDVDIIVAYGTPAAKAVFEEKTKIPIVYAAAYEPVVSNVKAKNITGISIRLSVSSLIRYLRGLTNLENLGVIYSSNEADSLHQFRELLRLAGQYGFRVEGIDLKSHDDADRLLSGKKIDAVLITGSSIACMASPTVMNLSKSLRIPYVSLLHDRTSHATIILSANPVEQGDKAAEKVIRILQGISPEKIKTDSSNDIELIFNLKEATAMGWRIPMELVGGATKLIQ